MAGEGAGVEDLVQVLGEKYRTGVLDVVRRMLDAPEFKRASVEERVQAEITGLMLGFCGALLSLSKPEGYAEIRSVVIEHLPTYFDDALEGAGFPRLSGVRTDPGVDPHNILHRLQAVMGGLPVNDGLNYLATTAATLMVTSCPTKEEAKRSATMLGEQVRALVLSNWSKPDIAALRLDRIAAARRGMN